MSSFPAKCVVVFSTGQLSCYVEQLSARLSAQSGWCNERWSGSGSPAPVFSVTSSTIRPPPPLVQSLLAVYCGRGCGKLVRLDNYDRHTAGNCQGYYHHQEDLPSKMMSLWSIFWKTISSLGFKGGMWDLESWESREWSLSTHTFWSWRGPTKGLLM